MCHAVPGKWCVFGCMLSAGGSFRWFRDELGYLETEATRIISRKGKAVEAYDLLIEEASQAPAGCEGLFFLPYLTGERCPHPDPNARGAWIGLTRRSTRDSMIRALLEGVTYGMRDAIEIMQEMGVAAKQVRASGGGAKSAFWRQLQADIYRKTLVLTNSSEGPAYGVALLAGVGTGCFKNVEEACTSAIRETARVKPNQRAADLYDRHYALYRKLYADLKQRFGEIAELA
jgi:xylulokinase